MLAGLKMVGNSFRGGATEELILLAAFQLFQWSLIKYLPGVWSANMVEHYLRQPETDYEPRPCLSAVPASYRHDHDSSAIDASAICFRSFQAASFA